MKKSTFYIVGKHAVVEALKNPKRRVVRVFLTEDSKKKNSQRKSTHKSFKKFECFL